MSRIAWILLATLLAGPLDPFADRVEAKGSQVSKRRASGAQQVAKRKLQKKQIAKKRLAAKLLAHKRATLRRGNLQTAEDLRPKYRALSRGVGYWSGTLRTAAGPVRLGVLKIDLKQADVAPVLARHHGSGFGLERTSSMSSRTGAIAGINGSFFSPRNKEPMDLLVVNGHWHTQPASRPAFVFKGDGTASIVAPRRAQSIPLLHAVGGGPTLLRDGRMSLAWWPRSIGGRAPRTAAGLTWDGKVLLVTVDGRSKNSVGATIREEARYMAALGAREAMNLDGGGSSTMVVGAKVMNRPSDGSERSVSNGLLVFTKRAVAMGKPGRRPPYSGIHMDRS